jgi:hypothetical protein
MKRVLNCTAFGIAVMLLLNSCTVMFERAYQVQMRQSYLVGYSAAIVEDSMDLDTTGAK